MSAQAEYSRRKSVEKAEVGPLPKTLRPDRRELCRMNLLLFLQTYFPETTGSGPFSAAHIEFIDDLQDALIHGGKVARAVFRGFAKTTIAENSCIWALLYGHKKFIPLVGGDQKASKNNLRSIKEELKSNDLLLEDFPEVCHPIRMLEGKVQRTHSQTVDGETTRMSWTGEHVVLPTIKDSPSSGGCLMTLSITAYRRGLVHKDAEGIQHRPDFVFIDDPQTDRSARSPTMVEDREHTLSASILKSAGHKKAMSVFVAGTIIEPNDMMDRLINSEIYPGWRAKRVPMLIKRAKGHDTIWLEQYASIRRDFDKDIPGDDRRAANDATEFYSKNREAMDEGCEVTWHQCYSEELGEISAIQHTYNMLIDDGEATFASECQNEPLREKGDLERIAPSDLEKKQNPNPQGLVPQSCEWLTAFVDVQGAVLYWSVIGWDKHFTGHVVDYGTWPRQRRRTFRLASLNKTLKKAYGSTDQNAVTLAGLQQLFQDELGPEWKRADGATMRLSVAAVDAGWSESGEAVRSFCQGAQYGFPIMPSLGRSITAGNAPMSEWPRKKGQRHGDGWCITKPAGRVVRTLLIDTNMWKARVTRSLALPLGAQGAIDLYKDDRSKHREYAEQVTSEAPRKTEGGGRTVFEWRCPPGVDNHFFDCLVGCAALANVAGVERPGGRVKPVKKRRRRVRYAS